MTGDLVITGARLILDDDVLPGTVVVRDGLIHEIADGATSIAGAVHLDGGWLAPGLVDLHCDNLEKHMLPRAGVRWDAVAAVLAHDALVAAAGVTTVFDSLVVGTTTRAVGRDFRADSLSDMIGAIATLRARGLLAGDHLLHLRCEVTDPGVPAAFARLADHELMRLISVMDHAPGHRQSPDLDRFHADQIARFGWTREDAEQRTRAWIHDSETLAPQARGAILATARERRIPVASHDDQTAAHVHEARRLGIGITEFPTTREAAEAARALEMPVIMGAPNLVRGKSHSGNASARELAASHCLDVLASDYVPASLLHAAFLMTREGIEWTLPSAIATVTRVPAAVGGLHDRGSLRPSMRADMIHVDEVEGLPVVKRVWTAGKCVFMR